MSSLPKLRLSEFSDSNTYCMHKFDDIFSFSSGKNIKQNESSPEFSTPCVRYGELYHMYGEVITKTINNTNLEHSELTFSAGNEILLPSAGEDPLDIGSASALTLEGVAIGRTINVLRPKGTIDYSHIYVSYYINEKLRKRISQLARGVSISNVYNSDLKSLDAWLPSLSEQQKIASFLSKVDEKIALLTEKKAKLTEYKKGVMQQLFDGSFQEQDGKLVFVPPTLRFKADDGSEFPDWEEVSLGSITTAMQSGISRQLHSEDIGYPILRSNNLSEGKVSFEDLKYWHLTDDQGADLTRYILEEGDLLVNFINSLSQIGKVAIYYNSMGRDVIYTTNIMRLKFNSLITSEFAFYSFNTRRYVNFIQSIAKPAVSQASFTTVDFKKYKMHVPTRAEQNKMTSLLLAIDKKIELINTELEKAKEWKKGLLQQMFV